MIKHYNYGIEYNISFRKVTETDTKLLKKFNCEYPAIRYFIRNQSTKDKNNVSYIFEDTENKRIIAFCSICCTGISIIDTAGQYSFITSIPTIKIDYFAVDEHYRNIIWDKDSNRHETLSQSLFLFMLEYIKNITLNIVGATHICLYSVPKAESFYKRCSFERFENYMNSDEKPFIKNCIPMFLEIDK